MVEPPLLRPPALATTTELPPETSGQSSISGDYRGRLATTALGWPRLQHWCVWIEPDSQAPAARIWEQRWRDAVSRALSSWSQVLSISVVEDPAVAQVHIWRRRPPLRLQSSGGQRASHGRATLSLQRVVRQGQLLLEPAVEVLISPAQRELAIQGTAVHELGHAFGLWGHSDRSEDVMAATPGATPVLQLSHRDIATLRWLYNQPSEIGRPEPRP